MVQSVNLSGITGTGTARRQQVRERLLDTIEQNGYMKDGKLTQDEITQLQTAVKNDDSYSGEDSILLNASLELLANNNKTYAYLAAGGGKDIDKQDFAEMRKMVKSGSGFGDEDGTDILAAAKKSERTALLVGPQQASDGRQPIPKTGNSPFENIKSLADGNNGNSVTLYDSSGNEIGSAQKLTPLTSQNEALQIRDEKTGVYYVFNQDGKIIGHHNGDISAMVANPDSGAPGVDLLSRAAQYGTGTGDPVAA